MKSRLVDIIIVIRIKGRWEPDFFIAMIIRHLLTLIAQLFQLFVFVQ